jgi:ABC-type lipoprotein export system ATPase subunit
MKISEIEIKSYQQFKDFRLDLTYPAGHPKAGKPLDKVCFIGQSGTGKTTLLNIMREVLRHRVDISGKNENIARNNYYNARGHDFVFAVLLEHAEHKPEKVFKSLTEISNNGNNIGYFFKKNTDNFNIFLPVAGNVFLYFNAELLDKNDDFIAESNINPKVYISDDEASELKLKAELRAFSTKLFYDFGSDSPIDIWKQILYSARVYMIEAIKQTKKLAHLIVTDIASSEKYIEEIKIWQQKNPNPFEALAKKANPFLHRFNLELKLNIDYDSPEDMKFLLVQPRNRHNEKLDYRTWSTGTKQVVMTATPLFALDTTDTVILFDEPERSLYPDVQRELVKFYTDLAPQAQFFFATHSPLIAAQFEPCERFVLTFNEEGYVEARPGRAPEGDDPNDVLTQDFMLHELLGAAGLKKREEFLELKSRVKHEQDQTKRDELMKQLFALQAEYNF